MSIAPVLAPAESRAILLPVAFRVVEFAAFWVLALAPRSRADRNLDVLGNAFPGFPGCQSTGFFVHVAE